jgi:hypothetical protein
MVAYACRTTRPSGRSDRWSSGATPPPTKAARPAAIYTLTETCKLNDVDPQARPADVLARRPDDPNRRIDGLLPWNWKRARKPRVAAWPPR